MKRLQVLFILILLFGVSPVWSQSPARDESGTRKEPEKRLEDPPAPKDLSSGLSSKDREILAMLELLELMEILEVMDVISAMEEEK